MLVGESPNRATVDRPDLWLLPDATNTPHTANVLLRLTGWTLDQYLETFSRRTFLWRAPGRTWPEEGRRHAREIHRSVLELGIDGIVAIGERVAMSFDMDLVPPFVWSGIVAYIPHPSGRSLAWTEPGARQRAKHFFSSLLA